MHCGVPWLAPHLSMMLGSEWTPNSSSPCASTAASSATPAATSVTCRCPFRASRRACCTAAWARCQLAAARAEGSHGALGPAPGGAGTWRGRRRCCQPACRSLPARAHRAGRRRPSSACCPRRPPPARAARPLLCAQIRRPPPSRLWSQLAHCLSLSDVTLWCIDCGHCRLPATRWSGSHRSTAAQWMAVDGNETMGVLIR